MAAGATEDSFLDLVYQTHGAADQAGNRKPHSSLLYTLTVSAKLLLTYLVGWWEGRLTCKIPAPIIRSDSLMQPEKDDKCQLLLTNPRDALHHGERAANK